MALVIIAQFVGLWRHWRNDVAPQTAVLHQRKLAAARILQVGGILLLLMGFSMGALIAAYLKLNGALSEVEILKNIVSHAAAGSELMNADFTAYGNYQASKGISVAAHAHINEMAILLLLLSLLQPFVLFSEMWTKRWAKIIVIGAITLPLAILAELQFGLIAGAIADIAGLVVIIIALTANLFGLLRFTGKQDSQLHVPQQQKMRQLDQD